MESSAAEPEFSYCAVWVRSAFYYVLWIVLAGAGIPELFVGLPSAMLCGWLSVRLLPAHGLRWRPIPLMCLAGRFIRDSVVAGVEIARIALRPKMGLKPGVIEYPSRLPEGGPRLFFSSYNSLMPGSLAVEPADNGSLQFHCLDTDKPVVEEMKCHEDLLLRSIGKEGLPGG